MHKFPLKVIIAMCVVAVLLYFASASYAKNAQANAKDNHSWSIEKADPLNDIDCAQMIKWGIQKQENLRAGRIMVHCGLAPAISRWSPETAQFLESISKPWAIGGVDVDTITGTTDPYPSVTQGESMVWGHGNTIFATINTSPGATCAGGSYGHGSYSTDGGVTFTRLCPNPFASGHGTNYGDPMGIYNANLGKWYVAFLATGCGGQGIGIWESTDAINWTTGACAHSGTSDDRESMWVDNNSGSSHYGRMYLAWNDFAAGQGIHVVYSDDGTTWSAPVIVTSTFIRDVQVTGSPGTDATVFIAGMDEGGGGSANRINHMYKSTDGGATWTGGAIGSAFAPVGSAACPSNSYFWMVVPIWRHMGWGQPAVGPANTVHYVYAGAGGTGDNGDIFYIRSTDNGGTWSTPIRLNTDATTNEQWMPSLVATGTGQVLASWYDRRNTTDGTNYERYGRVSNNGGVSWQTDDVISDVIIAQPLQPDSSIVDCYAGDYDYGSANGTKGLVSWTDGRTFISGNPQQDVEFDQVQLCATLPNAPTGTTATATALNQITVTWNAVSGASCYNVYRSVSSCPGSAFQKIGSCVSATTYQDTTVNGGVTYAYKVTSIRSSDGCESDFSSCAQATATGVCQLTPTFAGVASVVDNATSSCGMTINWSAGTSNCPLNPTVAYTVYKSTDPGFTPDASNQVATCLTGTTYLDSDVAYGLTFYYIVRAEDSNTGHGGPCNGGNAETNVIKKNGTPSGVPTAGNLNWPFETGLDGWTVTEGSWALSTARYNTGGSTASAHSTEYIVLSCDAMTSPVFTPTATTDLTLYTWYYTEDFNSAYYWDRAQLHAVNVDTGVRTLLTPTTGKLYKTGPFYDWSIYCDAIGTEEGWAGNATEDETWGPSGGYDFSALVGQKIKLELKMFSDEVDTFENIYVDDVTVTNVLIPTSCQNNSPTCTTPPIFAGSVSATNVPGSNCALALTWSPAASTCPSGNNLTYHIYRSTDPDFVPSASNRIASCRTGTTYADSNVDFATKYYYIVRAEDSTTNGDGPCNSGNTDLNVIKVNATPGYTVIYHENFEGATTGWIHSAPDSTCTTGNWIVGDPEYQTYSGVTTQLEDDYTPTPGINAFFTAHNPTPGNPGIDDVDNGVCTALSDVIDASAYSSVNVSIWYYFGQSDNTGGDAENYFNIDLSNDGGTTYPTNLVNFGNGNHEAAWTEATATVNNPAQIRFRVQASDGASNGDIIEGGIDEVKIYGIQSCSSVPTCQGTFGDVTSANPFCVYIEKLFSKGIAAGCSASPLLYCPKDFTQRQAMAKFVCLAMNSLSAGSCTTAACAGTFSDVPASNPFCTYIEGLYTAGVVNGCSASPLRYCPTSLTQRQAMAKFICLGMNEANPGSCTTAACAGTFGDVTSSNPFCTYIEGIYTAGVVNGCTASPLNYCPTANTNREQMAKFIVNAFAL